MALSLDTEVYLRAMRCLCFPLDYHDHIRIPYIPVNYFKMAMILIPIILILYSRNAQYFINTLFLNCQRRSDQHLNFQTDFGMARWHSESWPRSRSRESYNSRLLYLKCPHVLTALPGWSLPLCWRDRSRQDSASSLVFQFTECYRCSV